MRPISIDKILSASKLIEDKPYLATGIYFSSEEEKKYEERERERIVRLYSVVLERYLKSEEGLATIKLFKQVWEVPDKSLGMDCTLGWSRWRIFLYQHGWHNGPNGQEVIWFGGNGLERYFREGRSNKFQTSPITARELMIRMSSDSSGRSHDEVKIWRPEQVVPFIRLNAMDLVRFLNR
ncbi:MAG: hypothetical protein WC835_03180 [Candidatus Paceibacterota bacterium]|jgi:hypothetical protein